MYFFSLFRFLPAFSQSVVRGPSNFPRIMRKKPEALEVRVEPALSPQTGIFTDSIPFFTAAVPFETSQLVSECPAGARSVRAGSRPREMRCVAMGTPLCRLAARRGARQTDRRGVRRDARSSGPSASFTARAEPHRRGSERVESRFGRDSRGRASRPGPCPAGGGTPCVGGGSCRSARDRACTGARPRSSVITCPRTVETSA